MNTSVSLGKRIRSTRWQREMQAKELCEKAGISKSYISQIENGGRIPTEDILLRIAQAFEMSLEDLLAGVSDVDPYFLKQAARKRSKAASTSASFADDILTDVKPYSIFTSFSAVLTGVDPDGQPFTIVRNLGNVYDWTRA